MPVLLNDFRGASLNTKLDPWKLPANNFQTLENVVVRNGRLEPLKGLGETVNTGLSGNLKSLHRFNSFWVGSTVRRFFNNWLDQYLIYLDENGGAIKFGNGAAWTNLGVARPSTALSLSAGATGSGYVTGSSIDYVYTFVDVFGQESAPSEPATVTGVTNATISISGIPMSVDASVKYIKIYRTVSGSYLKVTTLTVGAATFTDGSTAAQANTALSDPLLTLDAGNVAPLEGLAIDPHIGRIWGWSGSGAYWSNTGAPWAWTLSNIIVGEPIKAMAGTTQGMLVLTTSRPYIIAGNDDSSFSLRPFLNTYGTSATFSLVRTDYGLVWWSPQGIVLYDQAGQFTLLTRDLLSGEDVTAYNAGSSAMVGAYARGYYYLFHSGGCLVYDLREGGLTTSTITADAVYADRDGSMWVAQSGVVKPWNSGTNLTLRVRTGEFTDEGSLLEPFHIRKAVVSTSGTVTYQWSQMGNPWGTYSPMPSNNGIAYCWATMGLWFRGDLLVRSSSAIRQIEINPEDYVD